MPAVSQMQAFLPTVAASNDHHSHFMPALSPLLQPITSRPPLVSVVGCKKASSLSATSRLLHWKSECNVSDSTIDKLLPILKDCVPDDAKIPRNFYETKKKLKSLEMPSQRIHVCINHCILFNGQHSDLDHCVVCKESIYKKNSNKVPNLIMNYMPIGPRLQRLFYSKKIAHNLT
uniref:Uncharacterized protein n=1 Tax=Lactuca sativa TaxID=4236 RepID=A0A9R1W5B9_LACSA|nr:hypothetical protein LSAT_V11C300127330 [Lactuca sativa]